MSKYNDEISYGSILKWLFMGISVVLISIAVIYGVLIGHKHYQVWSAEMSGKGRLMEASQSKQIMIETAKAEVEAATLRAQAITTIGEQAKKYPEYRQQEFIASFGEALNNNRINTIIFVPTEANIPIVPMNLGSKEVKQSIIKGQ